MRWDAPADNPPALTVMLLDIFDPKAPPKAIGIDLGTSHSIVAHIVDDKPTAMINCDGTALLPSVVHFGRQGEIVVGQSAKSYLTREPQRTIQSAKRFVGRSTADVENDALSVYQLASAEEGTAKEVRFDFGDRSVSAVEVSAEILKSLKQSASDQLMSVGGAVITVPAYFDDAQRQATRDAGRLAGLDVIRLLNEPTAAALAYGLAHKQNGTFVVYDLGGGTFDVTVLLLDDGVFLVKSTGGDSALGGDDMDRLIAEDMLVQMGFAPHPPRPPEIVSLALVAARAAKHALSEAPQLVVELPKKGGGQLEYSVSREQFDGWIAPLLARAKKACRRALRDAETDIADIDGVILVGGSTRVLKVRSHVAEIFGTEPLSGVDPDLVVAYGAAIQAEMLSQASDEVLLLDVLPLSLGIETMGGGIDKILPRNTSIPCGAKSQFTTYADNQTGFEIHVVQGERELAEDCRSLAKFSLQGIPPMPAGMARLEVEFHVDQDSLLSVSAKEVTTGTEQSVEVRPSYGLDDEQVEEMLLAAFDHGEDDFERRRLADARVEASRILLATQKALEADADLLDESEGAKVEAAVIALDEAIQSSQKASTVQFAIDEVDAVTHEWAGRRMNRAVQSAIGGTRVGELEATVSQARGVEAHLKDHRGE